MELQHTKSWLIITVLSCLHICQASLGTVTFLNPPESPTSVHRLLVRYSCPETSVVHLQMLLSFETESTSVIFQRRWLCSPGSLRTRLVEIRLPDWLVYQPDWMIQMSDWVLSCLLRAWMSKSVDLSSEPTRESLASSVSVLTVLGPLSRPFKEHMLCPSWETETLWKVHRGRSQCPVENEVASLLSSLYGSTGENYGIIKTLQPFTNRVLEGLRLKSISYPWCTFSLWVLLDQPCQQRMCGLLHHIDVNEDYASPSLFLKSSGHLHVQFKGEDGLASAFLSSFSLPLGRWCYISLELRGRMGKITATCIDEHQQSTVYSTEYTFSKHLSLDDTNGYFVIGGGKFITGIKGFYGPVTYYRTRIPFLNVSDLQLPKLVRMVNVSGWLQSCQRLKSELDHKISHMYLHESILNERCIDVYTELTLKTNQAFSRTQCSEFEPFRSPHRRLIAQLLQITNKHASVDPATLGRTLYNVALQKIALDGRMKSISRLMPSLLQAGCLGDNRALHLSSVLLSSGFGVEKQPHKAWLLALLAAQKDWRLALLRLGHLHRVGDQGVPADADLSYAYYSNIARQTISDQLQPSSQQTFVESILLNDEETLKAQTSQNHDIFQWLKLQARNGIADAERAVARMLFWGQQGVAPDIQTAIRHYERGATRLQDPVSMYDYAIVLLRGHGVPQDVPRAVSFLKKAMDQGFAPAITALGWYYEQFEKNYERAVELWEKADSLGNPDAAMNLGVFHLQGRYPGEPPDKVKAYKYFLKSAQRGHINGGIELAGFWTRGIPGYVARRPSDAVLWVKWASEQNGYLGTALRKGLNAYLKGNWFMALINYLICAECGFEAAQFNVAYLCEHSIDGSLNATFVTECMWRYYNLSIQNQNPASYALVKIGDLFYEECVHGKRPISDAAEMYKQAALKNDPQGWYSLGLLVQEGWRLPATLLEQLNLLQHFSSDKQTLLTSFYHRCRESNSDEAYLPCTLALLATHFQILGLTTVKVLSTLAIAVASIYLLKCLPVILHWLPATNQQISTQSDSDQPQEQAETSNSI